MDDTIVALATPLGEGAIHIVRLSGRESEKIVRECFRPVNEQKWSQKSSFTLHLGWFYDGNKKLDQVLVGRMRAPYSYTGENVFEINCHGGIYLTTRIIEACLHHGARLAEPGEFSKRAFLNGKMDLVQAEAVVDLISSRSGLSADLALKQLGGKLSSRIEEIRLEILNILSSIEAKIDFPEDEIEDTVYSELADELSEIRENALKIYKGSKTGKIIREGLSTVIAGRPNVGKSSLLNALIREERAIVTDIPGTTRDELHEYIKVGEVLLQLIDTAGIRESNDPVEKLGIERTWKALDMADVILFLLDAQKLCSRGLAAEEKKILQEYAAKTIVLINKIDLVGSGEYEQGLFPQNTVVLPFSVKEELGFSELEQEISRRVFLGEAIVADRPFLSNIRQIEAMEKCIAFLQNAIKAVSAKVPLDLVSIDIRFALEEISSITGHKVLEELLGNIFSRFCIGK